MPKDVKTNVIVSFETKGLQETSQQSAKFNKTIAESAKEQAKYYAEAAKNIERTIKEAEKAHTKGERQMRAMRDARRKQTEEEKAARRSARRAEAEEYQQQKRARKRAENEQYQEQRSTKRRAQRDQQQSQGAFRQGLAQGGLPWPAPFLQRGPGMWKQVAGQAVGRGGAAAMGIGRGLAGAGLSGISGIQQAVGSIPIVGGAAAGQIGIAAQMSQQFLQHQQARLAAAPYIVDIQRLAKTRSLTKQQKKAEHEYEKALVRSERAAEDLRGTEAVQSAAELDPELMRQTLARNPAMRKQMSTKYRQKLIKRQEKLAAETEKKKKQMEKMGVQSITPGTQDLAGLGLNLLGVNKTEALQAASAIVQAGGGRLKEARDNQAIRLGFAAQTAYGIQGQTAGAFLRAGRRGGMVDARGRGGDTMVEALQDGLRLGLEGSELNTYLQTIAAGIQQFEQTGIPVAKDSIAGMGQAFSAGGVIGGDRAARLGAGLTSYAQTIGTRGIKGGADLLMMQMMGGYQGGGAEELQTAFINMEQMRGTLQGKTGETMDVKGKTGDFLRRLIEWGGGGAGGEMMMRSVLSRMQVNMGQAEARVLGARLTGRELTPEEEAAAEEEMSRKARLAGEATGIGQRAGGRNVGLGKQAKGIVSRTAGRIKAQKAIENRQIEVGRQMVGAVQTLQRAATNTNEAFTNLVAGPLKDFSKWIEKLTRDMKELTVAVDKVENLT